MRVSLHEHNFRASADRRRDRRVARGERGVVVGDRRGTPSRSAELRIIHVFPALISIVGTTAHEYYPKVVKEQETMFEQALAAAPSMDDLDVERALIHGNPAEVLVDVSRRANLLVLGSHGRGTFSGMLLGSVSIHCVQLAHCPVVVVRHDD